MDIKPVNFDIHEITEQIKVYSINDEACLSEDLHRDSLEEGKKEKEHGNLKSNGNCNASKGNLEDDNKDSIPGSIDDHVQLENLEVSTNSITIMPGYLSTVIVCKIHKEFFCQFAKVLVRYLQLVHPSLHLHAKQIIRECDKFKKANKPGYEILAFSIQFNLRRLVGKQIWAKAADYHTKWLMNHYKKNDTYSLANEGKVAARRIVRIASQPLVHQSKLHGYRSRSKIVSMDQMQNQGNLSNNGSCDDEIDSHLGSIAKDYVVIERNNLEI